MKAMIFAAGLGTRLRPLTDNMPKALVKVGGIPMLGRVIHRLKDAGVDEFVVNVHHYPEQITQYLRDNDNFGVTIHISDERDKLLDTGGGILNARKWLDGETPFIVHNADIFTDFDIAAMIREHSERNSDVTLLMKERKTSRYLIFDCRNRMTGWKNETTGELRHPDDVKISDDSRKLAFGGVHIINPTIFPYLEEYGKRNDIFSITPFYTEYCDKLHIDAYIPSESYNWVDIGKLESLKIAENIASGS